MLLGNAAERPQRILQAFGQRDEALAAEDNMGMLEARECQPEVLEPMRQRDGLIGNLTFGRSVCQCHTRGKRNRKICDVVVGAERTIERSGARSTRGGVLALADEPQRLRAAQSS
jgi:hypothetical protein